MKSSVVRCLSVLAAVFAVYSCNGVRVIPRKDMVAIYMDMYVADQWIKESGERQRMADTSYVYRPILKRYGYTVEDFIHSVDYYTDRPKDFASVFETVASELRSKVRLLEAQERLNHARDSAERARETLPFIRPDFIHFDIPEYYVAKVRTHMDTVLNVIRFEAVDVFASDTTSSAPDIPNPAVNDDVAEESAE